MEINRAFKFTGQDAENYDYYMGPIIFEPYGRYLASRIDAGNVSSALEIACGTGRVTRHIRKALAPYAKLVASDLSVDMLAIAKRELNNNDIDFRVEDAQDLSFPDNTFDLVVCQFGMMFLPDKPRGFAEVYRVLKPGGKFMYFTWDDTLNIPLFKILINDMIVPNFDGEDTVRFFTPFSMYDPDQLRGFLTGAGFRDVKAENVALNSGRSTVSNLVESFFVKHRLGGEIAAKDPALLAPLAKKTEAEFARHFGEGEVQMKLSAFLTTGTK
ncbi:class I SAM-dependent methyltransferase [Mucilaginibacter sp.]|jgi:ubiquinone/menaquinone biosynthesis C-methylase UbiE|uniref:class I SAM-dependent methyltransferase n=1 Tax=Mucilaginibacter sp. TaxID=1882438 RepID=UPI002B540C6C|nr:class I SAM-dependent methyltransferase [Mucilaginibacter sp.]HTI59936.1 class I SAM-dependent methyltransferase [Mucilaginibacter sp.]